MADRKLILISNDDGVSAKGINSLVEYIKDLADIIVCAPSGPRSGFSRSFSISKYFQISKLSEEEGLQVWSCTGTPVDCVKIAISEICIRKPDLVIGGINHGNNSSINAHYSGTVGTVLEGCVKGIPSVAFSLCNDDLDADFSAMKNGIRNIVQKVLDEGLPKGVFLNVNYPDGKELKGVKFCRMGLSHWPNEIHKRIRKDGCIEYCVSYEYHNDEPDATDTDAWALDHGYVAITPTTIDVTHYQFDNLKNINI